MSDNSLIDVWKVSDGSSSYYSDNEADARRDKEAGEENGAMDLVITKEKMHREVFESLREFEGF